MYLCYNSNITRFILDTVHFFNSQIWYLNVPYTVTLLKSHNP